MDPILNLDAPDHTRLRRRVAKAFTVRRVDALRPRAADLRAAGSPADLVAPRSVPRPVTII